MHYQTAVMRRKTESKTLYFKSSRKRLYIKILREEEQQRCEIGVCIFADAIRQTFAVTKWRGTQVASHLPGVPPASLGERASPKTPLQTKKQLFGGTTIEKKTVKRNRHITYSFRVSERERRIIDEKVKISGLSRTDFLIRALTDKPVSVIANGGEILQELKRQGNNLNQAVRNCYFYPDEKDKVLSAAAECKRAYRALLSVIGGN